MLGMELTEASDLLILKEDSKHKMTIFLVYSS